MRGVGKCKLSLRLVGSLELETASRKSVHQVNCDVSAICCSVLIGIVAYNPNVGEVSGEDIVARCYLCSVRASNISRSDKRLCRCSVNSDKSAACRDFPRIKLFKLLHVLRAVVDIFAEVRISRGGVKRNTASCRAYLVFRFKRTRCGSKSFGNNRRVKLKLLKSIARNFSILHTLILS